LIWVKPADQNRPNLVKEERPVTLQDQTQHQNRAPQGMSRNARIALVFTGFATIAGALLFTEHRAHVLGLLVWLPLLACPLMHLFMHGGHHHGGHHRRNDGEPRSP
jgi:hypothetical protein